ncbi:hypothetical protein GGTG_11852 [Gaeumannomyces tritici R3-111a-1]|uniref:Uncharacterized protein n=1 Tax=Gaeumannomyces tritici (strain R3-111a-1) TaxID=644352 RepID=J3PEC7_GAET3|nr:hypothetical protein GGTG_11852 [Gaeumannomyces tritici R3-111a-1]EJT70829.1 hypothetical protein GGTG_11852 [Gaeumannomyces tritici R3-111a-1]
MTIPAELFLAVFATAMIILVTAILFGRHPRQPLEVPKAEELTFRVDNIPIDHAHILNRNSRAIAGWDPNLNQAAIFTAPKPKSLAFRVNNIPIDHADELDLTLRFIAGQDPTLQGAAAIIVYRFLAPQDKQFGFVTVLITTLLFKNELSA